MNNRTTSYGQQILTSLVAVLLVTTVLGPVGLAGAQTVSFEQSVQGDTTVSPGETITIEATITTDDNGPAIDVDPPTNAWTITNVDDDGGTFKPSENQWIWLGGNHTVTYTVEVPSSASTGDYTVAGEGSSANAGPASDDLTITVEEANQAPTADAGTDQTVEEGKEVTLDASGSSDPDGDSLTYSWTQMSGQPVSLSDTSAQQSTFTAPAVDSETDLTFEVDVSDGQASDTDTVNVTVQPAQEDNQAPTIDAISDQTVTEGDSATVQVNASDPDGDPVTLSLSQSPDFVSLSNGEISINPMSGDAGNSPYTVAVTASDGNGGSATESFQVTVNQAATPTVSFSQTVTSSTPVSPGETVTIEATITTNDNGPAIDVDPPTSAWTVTNDTDDGGTFKPSENQWVWLSGNHTVTYTLEVPSSASTGDYTLVGAGSSANAGPVFNNLTVPVETDQDPSAALTITPNSGLDASTYTDGAFQLKNTGGQNIESVEIDLSSTALPDMVFDPQGTAGDGAGKGLVIDSQSGDGVGVVSTAEADVFSQPHNGVDGDDGYDVLTIEFSDFEPGETVSFSADNDPTSIKGATLSSQEAGPISGLELAGATVTVDYAEAVQTTQVIGDGSQGGAEAVADETVPMEPTITVKDTSVSLDSGALDTQHTAATVSNASQNITVFGSLVKSGDTVMLMQIEGELELDNVPTYNGTPGYEIEDYEANKAESVTYYTDTVGQFGEVDIPVTLMKSTDVGGYNYFVAVEVDEEGAGKVSNVIVLEYDPDADTGPGPIGDFQNAPTDPDGDGLYEDVNGDGSVNVGDAQAIFANSQDPVVQNNVAAFDFNDDGSVNVGDAQALFATGIGV